MDQFNTLHVEEPNEPTRECNIQPPAYHFKSTTSPPKTSPVVSDIMGRLNHNAIDNGDVAVHPSEFPDESNSESFPDPNITLIKSIDDDEMKHIHAFFHSEHDEDLLDIDFHMLQA